MPESSSRAELVGSHNTLQEDSCNFAVESLVLTLQIQFLPTLNTRQSQEQALLYQTAATAALAMLEQHLVCFCACMGMSSGIHSAGKCLRALDSVSPLSPFPWCDLFCHRCLWEDKSLHAVTYHGAELRGTCCIRQQQIYLFFVEIMWKSATKS